MNKKIAVLQIEQFGDFWQWDPNQPDVWPPGATNMSYLNAAYFSMVTMATVSLVLPAPLAPIPVVLSTI